MLPDMAELGHYMAGIGKPVDTTVSDNVLTVTVRKEFDAGNIHQDWAQSVQVMHPGPFAGVVFDLSQCGLVSSTFFAGLIQLHQHYAALGMPRLVIRHPDQRVSRNLKALRLDVLFKIEPRPTA